MYVHIEILKRKWVEYNCFAAKNVISGIIWSEELDKTFRNNYKQDPTLSWQYFGSSTGFMRQFPGKKPLCTHTVYLTHVVDS